MKNLPVRRRKIDFREVENLIELNAMQVRAVLCALLFLPGLFTRPSGAQEAEIFQPAGKVSGIIYSNFHNGITAASKSDVAFEIIRVYLGYERLLTPEISSRITLDIGSPDDVSPFSKLRRYAYFKYAYVAYEKENLEMQFGLIGTLHYKLQEQLWERRYLRKAFADEFKMGPSADLGFQVVYHFTPLLTADITMMNGEGFTRFQMDDSFKYGAGLTFGRHESWISRVYADYMKNGEAQISWAAVTSVTFLKKVNLTFEYNYQHNYALTRDHHLFGWSAYGKYNLGTRTQLFARYDQLHSNIPDGQTHPWHLADDGSALVGGIQFAPVKPLKIALSYQDWVPWAANLDTRAFLYLNMEISL